MKSSRLELRLALVPPAGAITELPDELSRILQVLPVTASMARTGVYLYVRLRQDYEVNGSSPALTSEALALINDLGTVLQGLRRDQVWLQALSSASDPGLRALSPPMFLLDTIYNSLVMLTVDDPDTLDIAIAPEELDRYFTATDAQAWFLAVDAWTTGPAAVDDPT